MVTRSDQLSMKAAKKSNDEENDFSGSGCKSSKAKGKAKAKAKAKGKAKSATKAKGRALAKKPEKVAGKGKRGRAATKVADVGEPKDLHEDLVEPAAADVADAIAVETPAAASIRPRRLKKRARRGRKVRRSKRARAALVPEEIAAPPVEKPRKGKAAKKTRGSTALDTATMEDDMEMWPNTFGGRYCPKTVEGKGWYIWRAIVSSFLNIINPNMTTRSRTKKEARKGRVAHMCQSKGMQARNLLAGSSCDPCLLPCLDYLPHTVNF